MANRKDADLCRRLHWLRDAAAILIVMEPHTWWGYRVANVSAFEVMHRQDPDLDADPRLFTGCQGCGSELLPLAGDWIGLYLHRFRYELRHPSQGNMAKTIGRKVTFVVRLGTMTEKDDL
ncbi:hypothetical protein PG993_010517 [Apiospora rasikravindrae]|uniref:Uncharacterized protein n=1 Tax=Apiospora rasikravindrae TaxID=990691 RepID=A0ABR1SMF5_9PEZI